MRGTGTAQLHSTSMRGVCDHIQDLAAWDYNTEQMEWVRAHFYNFDRMGASAAQATHQRSHALPGMGGGFFEGCIIGPQPLLQCTRSFNTERLGGRRSAGQVADVLRDQNMEALFLLAFSLHIAVGGATSFTVGQHAGQGFKGKLERRTH